MELIYTSSFGRVVEKDRSNLKRSDPSVLNGLAAIYDAAEIDG